MNVGRQIARDTGSEAAAAPDRPVWRPGRPAALWLVAACLLSLVTWAVFAVPRHYQPVPAAWPLDRHFQALATVGGSADPAPLMAGPCGTCGHPDGPGACAMH